MAESALGIPATSDKNVAIIAAALHITLLDRSSISTTLLDPTQFTAAFLQRYLVVYKAIAQAAASSPEDIAVETLVAEAKAALQAGLPA